MFVNLVGCCSRLRKKLRKRHPDPLRPRHSRFAWVLTLLPLILMESVHPRIASFAYDHALKTFRSGYLLQSQQEAEHGYGQFKVSDPAWAAKFLLLDARANSWQGRYADADRLLEIYRASGDPEDAIQKLVIEGILLAHRQQFAMANQRLAQADNYCKNKDFTACGELIGAHGVLADIQGHIPAARKYYLDSLNFARNHQDLWSGAIASANLGWIAIEEDRYEDAVDWLKSTLKIANEIDAKYLSEGALGNLGLAYFELGDIEKAMELFTVAEKRAVERGDIARELRWLEDIGSMYQMNGDEAHAATIFHQTLALARQIDSKDDIVCSLEDLAYSALSEGRLVEAGAILDQLTPFSGSTKESGNMMDLMLLQGMLASARRQDRQAEALFLAIEKVPSSQILTRLQAGFELAKLFEAEGRTKDAERAYKTKLAAFESARSQLRHEDSKLPFMANAVQLYDGYIHLLVQQGRTGEALKIANQSRARTLEQSLERGKGKSVLQPAAFEPVQIARKAGANLLFYWLGEKQSYLWVVTPRETAFYTLPAQKEISSRIVRYRKALLEVQNPLDKGSLEASNQDGRALYSMLVAPASSVLRPGLPVVIMADGVLSQLNFETLLAPGNASGQTSAMQTSKIQASTISRGSTASGTLNSTGSHYWIEDATILSAPSLTMLATAKPDGRAQKKLLLMGNSLAYGDDYPELPMAGMEMKLVEKHFDAARQTVLSRERATPVAYLASSPEQYSYIHFVAHGTTSKTEPLNSAIILSRSAAEEDSFKLYAREILRHPIDARLVTISSCYGGGIRSYAGEGLVGLSWAFLRAGAHNVIGAQWEVSDNATPRLMDNLYKGLEEGQTPSAALRAAKLSLLHSSGNFRAPFFWAGFQIYTGH
jgi:tetratricopeptide (TPR) repeat protein